MTHASDFWIIDPSREASLREMRSEGLTYSAIAEALGCTKNAAIGKAHRLGICDASSVSATLQHHYPILSLEPRDCRWPIGHPNEADFHFCGATVAPDRPYCAEHAAMAYVRVPPRSLEAA